jgi:hypothetical protein
MSKHTPGPWKVDKGKLGFPVVFGPQYEVASPSFCGVNYGKLKTDKGKAEEILANAHLIAAAPHLLDALKEHLEAFEPLYDWLNNTDAVADYADKYPAEFERQCKAMEQTRAAIKKATGQ